MASRRIQRILFAGRTILAVGIFANYLSAQTDNQNEPKEYVSEIFAEAFAFKSDSSGKGRLDIYIQVPYPEINFVKEGEQYVGRIEISATVLTQEKQELWQTSQTVELRLKDFTQTISHRLSTLKRFSTDLLPGKYELLLQVADNVSKKIAAFHKSVVVKDFSTDSLAMSDLMLVHRMRVDGTRKNIVPNLTGALAKESNGFYLFFEIYNRTQLDSVQLLCKLINQKKEVITQRTKSEALSGNRTQMIWQIDTPALAAGQYVFFIEVTGYTKVDPAVMVHTSSSRTCLVRIKDLPLTVTDIDKATDQLQYIAKGSEIAYIKEAAVQEERQKRFLEFWAKRNPDSKTSRNELMEEYYARVAYANKNFTGYMEGWKTDRGMVLIQFGLPQNVDRHPFDSESKPYEIWYYYDQNREFIFVDETGLGDYRLQYPETDLQGRIR
ncbi:MAG: GWxTD domain-containing protein [Bacteroidota bacterium]|jgi:GWxTD domain-containing protein